MKKILVLTLATLTFFSTGLMAEEEQSNKISKGKYIAGGVVSILAPFGIGQAVQGRYQETGWIFTVADSASLAVLTTGAIVTAVHVSNNTVCAGGVCTTTGTLPAAGISLYVIGAAAFAGFRVWEVVDAWVTPPSEKRVADAVTKKGNDRLAFVPVLAPNYMGFAMQF